LSTLETCPKCGEKANRISGSVDAHIKAAKVLGKLWAKTTPPSVRGTPWSPVPVLLVLAGGTLVASATGLVKAYSCSSCGHLFML
jgi:hypothetical protein